MNTTTLRKVLMFGAFVGFLSGCSMDASIQNLVPIVNSLKALGQAHGIASGAGQAQTTNTGNYQVSSAVGLVGGSSTTTNSVVTTTSGGYKVYSSVQGAIVSQ